MFNNLYESLTVSLMFIFVKKKQCLQGIRSAKLFKQIAKMYKLNLSPSYNSYTSVSCQLICFFVLEDLSFRHYKCKQAILQAAWFSCFVIKCLTFLAWDNVNITAACSGYIIKFEHFNTLIPVHENKKITQPPCSIFCMLCYLFPKDNSKH